MKFLLDANLPASLGRCMTSVGHDVRCLAGTSEHDLPDEEVLNLAYRENRILLTRDKGFGNLIFLQRHIHHGVVLFRLKDESIEYYAAKMQFALSVYGENLHNHYLVITDYHFRFR